jgi:hypothetical protein
MKFPVILQRKKDNFCYNIEYEAFIDMKNEESMKYYNITEFEIYTLEKLIEILLAIYQDGLKINEI